MQRVDTIRLLTATRTQDAIGQDVENETGKTVICTVQAVSRAEWAAAGQRSLSPAAVVRVFFADYGGEKLAEMNGRRYAVYRTYQAGDYVELYLGEKAGDFEATTAPAPTQGTGTKGG